MGGPHLDEIGQFEETRNRLVQRLRRLAHDADLAGGCLQQVRPAEITDEHEVARKNADRLLRRATAVGDHERHVLRGMAGRVHGAELDLADVEGVAVVQQLDVVVAADRPYRMPLGPALVRQVQGRADAFGELARAGEKVGVDMGFRGGDDLQTFGFRNLEVAIDVALGVDDDRLAGALAADHVGVLGESIVGYTSNKHGRSCFQVWGVAIGEAGAAGCLTSTTP